MALHWPDIPPLHIFCRRATQQNVLCLVRPDIEVREQKQTRCNIPATYGSCIAERIPSIVYNNEVQEISTQHSRYY